MVENDSASTSGEDNDGKKRKSADKARTKKQLKKKKTLQNVLFNKGGDEVNVKA